MIFDRQGLRAIQGDFERAMAATAKTYGVSLKVKAARFTNANAELKFEIAAIGPNGESHTPERMEFGMLANRYNLGASDLDGLFTVNGTAYRITGIKPNRPKFPICGTRVSDGKTFKFSRLMIGSISHK